MSRQRQTQKAVERIRVALNLTLNRLTPHPSPVASQARHESVSRDGTCASRIVVPVEGRGRRWRHRTITSGADCGLSCKFPNNAGFTLIEVMCAILILGIALIGLTQGINIALISSKESELQTTAALFAASRIEMIRADGLFSDGEKDGDCGDDLPLFQWKQSITPSSVAGLHEVTVTVENAKSGVAVYELHTMLFDPTDSAFEDTGKKKDTDKSKEKKKKGGRA